MRMRLQSLVVTVLACALAPAVVAGQEAPNGAAGPRIVVSETDHDLGLISRKAPVAPISIAIRNTGSGPLRIGTVRTTCPCLRADVSSRVVAMGASTPLTLEFKPLPYDDDVDEQVLVYTNDPVHPLTKIRLSGAIGNVLRLKPTTIPFIATYRGDISGRRFAPVRITASDHEPIAQVRLTASHPSIKPEGRQLEDGSYEVSITVDQTIPVGRIEQYVRVEADHPKAVVDIPVVGAVLGELDPGGRRVDFGLIKEGQPASVTFLLPNRSSRDIAVTHKDVKTSVPVDVEITPEGKSFKLVARVSAQPPLTPITGSIELQTNNPDEPLVRIPVRGGVLATKPFDVVKADGSDTKLLAIVKDALTRQLISNEQFFSEVLGGVDDERASAILLRALAEGDLPMRMRAVELLGTLKNRDVLEKLRTVITDDTEEFVRRNALAAYADAVGKAAVPSLLLALQDDNAWVREDAATYLGDLGDASVIPALRAAMNDPDPDTRAAVRAALAELQSQVK